MSPVGMARWSTSTGSVRSRIRYATSKMPSATTIATTESIHRKPCRVSKMLRRTPTVMNTSARVCAASATNSSLPSSVPRRCSYHVMSTFTPRVRTSSTSWESLTLTPWLPLPRWVTASRTSSKQVIDRNPTMASEPSVSKFPGAYGWSSTGSLGATRATVSIAGGFAGLEEEGGPANREGGGGGDRRAARGGVAQGAVVVLVEAGGRATPPLLRLGDPGGAEHAGVKHFFPPLQLAQQIE